MYARTPSPRRRCPQACYNPCKIVNRTHEQRIVLSLNGGFIEGPILYVYLVSIESLGRFGRSGPTHREQSVVGHVQFRAFVSQLTLSAFVFTRTYLIVLE